MHGVPIWNPLDMHNNNNIDLDILETGDDADYAVLSGGRPSLEIGIIKQFQFSSSVARL